MNIRDFLVLVIKVRRFRFGARTLSGSMQKTTNSAIQLLAQLTDC